MKKRDLLAGTGALAAALAAYMAVDKADHVVPVPTEAVAIEEMVAAEEASAPALMEAASPAPRWAIGAALGTLIGGFAAVFGFNWVANFLSASRKVAADTAQTVVSTTKKAARATGTAAKKVLRGPSRWLAKAGVVTVGAMSSVSALNLSWELSLILALATLLAAMFGWKRPEPAKAKVKTD